MRFRLPVALAALSILCAPLLAHHSAAAEYFGQVVTWQAVITRFSWMNPHTFVYFDAKNPGGVMTNYICEGSAPSGLIGNGWTRNTLKPGDHVTVKGYRAKDRADGCKIRSVVFPDGHEMIMGWDGSNAAPR